MQVNSTTGYCSRDLNGGLASRVHFQLLLPALCHPWRRACTSAWCCCHVRGAWSRAHRHGINSKLGLGGLAQPSEDRGSNSWWQLKWHMYFCREIPQTPAIQTKARLLKQHGAHCAVTEGETSGKNSTASSEATWQHQQEQSPALWQGLSSPLPQEGRGDRSPHKGHTSCHKFCSPIFVPYTVLCRTGYMWSVVNTSQRLKKLKHVLLYRR